MNTQSFGSVLIDVWESGELNGKVIYHLGLMCLKIDSENLPSGLRDQQFHFRMGEARRKGAKHVKWVGESGFS